MPAPVSAEQIVSPAVAAAAAVAAAVAAPSGDCDGAAVV